MLRFARLHCRSPFRFDLWLKIFVSEAAVPRMSIRPLSKDSVIVLVLVFLSSKIQALSIATS